MQKILLKIWREYLWYYVWASVYQSQHMDKWPPLVCSLGLNLEYKRHKYIFFKVIVKSWGFTRWNYVTKVCSENNFSKAVYCVIVLQKHFTTSKLQCQVSPISFPCLDLETTYQSIIISKQNSLWHFSHSLCSPSCWRKRVMQRSCFALVMIRLGLTSWITKINWRLDEAYISFDKHKCQLNSIYNILTIQSIKNMNLSGFEKETISVSWTGLPLANRWSSWLSGVSIM